MIIATAILIFSIVGLITLLTLKAWEQRRGRLLLPSTRSHLELYSTRLLAFAHMEAPRKFGRFLRIMRRLARAYISYGFARILFHCEQLLERVLHTVRSAPTNLRERGEASPFLREVAAYKRMLDREVEQKRVSAENL